MAMERARAAIDRAAGRPSEETGARGGNSSRFLRGVAIGALVGAAIAGSTVWQRRRVRGRIRRELADTRAGDATTES